jgi:hypothetical protein
MTLDDIKDRCFIDDDGCWIWRGGKSGGVPKVYAPNFSKPGAPMESQVGRRAVWQIVNNKPIPPCHRVYKTCEKARCLNPAHMRCGSNAQVGAFIAKSGVLKGSAKRIAANRLIGRKRSTLTPALIAEIQQSSETGLQLAQRLNLGREIVSRARRGEIKAFAPIASPFSGLMP